MAIPDIRKYNFWMVIGNLLLVAGPFIISAGVILMFGLPSGLICTGVLMMLIAFVIFTNNL